MADDPFDGIPTRMRATIETFINHIIQEAIASAERELHEAGLVATVAFIRDGGRVDLIIKSQLSREDHSRAEDILEGALQSVLSKVSGNQHTLH